MVTLSLLTTTTLFTQQHKLRNYSIIKYTVSNLAFAVQVEPENEEIAAKAAWAQAQRAAQAFTVPSTVGAERKHNVFLRCGCASVKATCEVGDGASVVECLGALRSLKDSGRFTRKR